MSNILAVILIVMNC